jgi:two-component sensor histidine kinase
MPVTKWGIPAAGGCAPRVSPLVADRPWLRLISRETGGPAVQVPGRKGFGSRLIEQSLAGAGGRTTVRYEATGIVCELECPCL